jgi:predicted nucleic acid-binding protein
LSSLQSGFFINLLGKLSYYSFCSDVSKTSSVLSVLQSKRWAASAVVLAQLAYWVRSKEGRQRQVLQAWFTRLMAALHGRILSFNASVVHVWAEQQRTFERAGRRTD